jgi:hypothetical protein
MVCNLFYEDSECLFPFQNTHVEAVHVDQLSNVWNAEPNNITETNTLPQVGTC